MASIKERLKQGELVIGTFISEVRNPNVAYMLAQAGFDFFVLDNEHGSFSVETVSDMVAAARGSGLEVIVRIPEIRRESILKPLDSGAAGLLVPQVNTPEQACELVWHAKYPPMGNRGAALRRAHSLYGRPNAAEYLAKANDETLLVVQAESREAIRNADRIAAVEGIDCVFCGPFDLSVSLGIPGQLAHPMEVEAIETMLAACRKAGKAAGILLFDPAALKPWIEKGIRFACYSSDINMLADAAMKAVEELRRSQAKG
ncbi:MAG: HpcH/HpaI aldolase/citrate lyase family protein [Acidobacteriota bacterium]